MSDPSSTKAQRMPGRRIPLPNGDVLIPRHEFAADDFGVTDRTVRRMNLPTTYIGNVAHVPKNESLTLIAARISRPNQRRR
jgi:hypothetical protein